MEVEFYHYLVNHIEYAIVISLLVQIVIALSGILPSYFVTAANIALFGFMNGFILSLVGEAIGALIAFVAYRKGFKQMMRNVVRDHSKIQQLMTLETRDAFRLIIVLRIMPFVPSGFVTFGAAIGSIAIFPFFVASTIGKIPALLLEAAAVHELLAFTTFGKMILFLIGILIMYQILRTKSGKKQ